MANYQAPIDDIRFTLEQLVGLDGICELPGYEDASPELVASILDEGASRPSC